MSRPIDVSIVIPAYNEEKRLPDSIRDIRAFFSKFQVGLEVLIMVEKSSDRTVEVGLEAAKGCNFIHVIDNEVHRGKGYAVRCGILRARGHIIFFMDADLSTPLSEVVAFLGHFTENPQTDVVIGSREHAKSQILRKQSWLRRNLGRGFNRFVQGVAMGGITDTQCGFKAFRAPAAHEVFTRQKLNGFAFDVECLMLAQELGYKIDVRPVRWFNSPDSKVRIWIDPLKMLWDLLRTRRLVRRSIREQPLSPSAVASPKSVSSAGRRL